MKIAVFDDYRIGVVEGESVRDVTALVGEWPSAAVPWRVNEFYARLPELAASLASADRGESVPLSSVRLLAPSPRPLNLFAAPLNYRSHKAEMQGPIASGGTSVREMGFFLKSVSAITGPRDPIALPAFDGRRFDYEGEIAVLIGRGGRTIPRERALEHVAGYTLTIDATMRMTETQREERTYRKSFWSFAPLGPWLVTADEVPDPSELDIELLVNGELRQSSTLAELVLDVPGLIEQASRVVPLSPGDVYATGTPGGIGELRPGDVVTVRSSRIGEMTLNVVERDW